MLAGVEMRSSARATRLIVLGGFLGAGKTTAILRLARRRAARGERVGVIANDLSEGLVDAATYRAHGLPAEELPGGCFSCRFDALLAAAGRLVGGEHPDVLIAEPAGSCTDLVAKAIEPLRRLYSDCFAVAPYATLLDPLRAAEALGGRGSGGLSARVAYLFRMQQNEAEIVAINKADLLTERRRAEVELLAARAFPNAHILTVSAQSGEGFDAFEEALFDAPPRARGVSDALAGNELAAAAGDASLAWVNGRWSWSTAAPQVAESLAIDWLDALRVELAAQGCRPVHVKCAVLDGPVRVVGVANLLDAACPPSASMATGDSLSAGELLVNARVEGDAASVRVAVERAAERLAANRSAQGRWLSITALAADPTNRFCAVQPVRSREVSETP